MSLRLEALVHDAHDPERIANFWGALLGRVVAHDDRGWFVPGSDTQVGLRFVEAATLGEYAVHVHVTSEEAGDKQTVVDRAISLGATHLDVGQLPDERHVVLADPEGNPFCVIEPENNYLRGTGPLGELACDGLRHTGLFWSSALGWPLVWDQDEETAIQSLAGGTKVAWGGPPLESGPGRDRQRFGLVADDLDAEVERLVGLGAVVSTSSTGGSGLTDGGTVELTDPDGHEFTITRA